jgi:methyl-accepting chemotaxis protein
MKIHAVSVSKKISLSLFILILGYFISMISFFINGRNAEVHLHNVAEDFFSAAQISQHAVRAYDEQSKAYEDAVMIGDEESIELARQKSIEAENALQQIIELQTISAATRKKNRTVLEKLKSFTKEAQPVYLAMSNGTDTPELMEQALQLGEQSRLLHDNLLEIGLFFANALKKEVTGIAESSRVQRMRNVWIFVSTVTVSLLLSFFIVMRYIIRPLDNTVKMMQDIAEGEGDLTKRLAITSNDEIGELARWFNNFIENIHGLIQDVADNSAQLEKASSVLAATSGQLANGAANLSSQVRSSTALTREISGNVHDVTETAEAMSGHANIIADSSRETSANVTSVAAAVEEMNATISEVARSCAKAQELAGQGAAESSSVRDEINALNEAAQDIGTIVDIITRITGQVNLLALNATIEAAGAGDAGRGFAVVANEIKELAKQTAGATEGIGTSIQAIQDKTSAVFESINRVSSANKTVNEITTSIAAAVEQQSATTREISSMVTNAAHGVEEVSKKVNELNNDISGRIVPSISGAASGVNQVSSSVQAMTDVATNTVSSVSDIDNASGELSTLASRLNSLVGKFKLV